jgi:tRNA threonylcarbamoyladenosine biosynthesis protein TsaB
MPGAEVILAIETSQRAGSVALDAGTGAVRAESLGRGPGHDERLMPAIKRLFEEAQLPPEALTAVGVSIGPGGFTGLRIAVATAKMLAMTLNAKVVAVPSATVAAMSSVRSGGESDPPTLERLVLVTLAAKRESFWATTLRATQGVWTIVDPGRLMTAADLSLEGIVEVLGDKFLPAAARQRCEDAGVPVRAPSFQATACLEATGSKLRAGQITDPRALKPLYPRPPEAVTRWQQGR